MIVATGFGAGLLPIAPGTAGSALALALGWLFAWRISSSHMPSVVAAVGLLTSGLLISLAGVPIVARAEAAIGRKDPGPIVLDEIAGQFLASGIVPLFAYPSPRSWSSGSSTSGSPVRSGSGRTCRAAGGLWWTTSRRAFSRPV